MRPANLATQTVVALFLKKVGHPGCNAMLLQQVGLNGFLVHSYEQRKLFVHQPGHANTFPKIVMVVAGLSGDWGSRNPQPLSRFTKV